jgi:hypothetical protein
MRVFVLLFAGTLTAQTVVVSPDDPVKTPAEARDAARAQHRAGRTGPITIEIRDGVYFLPETLALTADDSNTVWQAAPGARPVISGGRVIGAWKKGAGPIWTADASGPEFHQLFVSGRRVQRARTPNYGYYRIDGASPQDKPVQLRYRGNDMRREWAARGDVEVIALRAWADFRMPIVSVNETAHIATLTLEPRPSNKEADARYYIENAPDALDMAGEWYLDRKTHEVRYWPMPGEDMRSEQVIAPALTQLVRMEGTRNIVFRGLQFAHADWEMPEKGYADTQAAIPARAAIEAIGSSTAKSSTARSLTRAATPSSSGADRNGTRSFSASCSIWAAAGCASVNRASFPTTPTRTTKT